MARNEPGWEPAFSRRACLSALSVLLPVVLAGCGGKKAADDASPDKSAPTPTVAVASVTRGSLEKTLSAAGTLQSLPGKEASVTPATGGVLDGLYLRYGQDVVKGQVVAHLSPQQALGQIQQAQATLGQNEVQVQQAEANALQQQAQTKTSILQAQAAVRNAQASVRNAQAALSGAEATLTGDRAATDNARQSLDRAQKLFADGLIPAKDVEAARLAVSTAQATEDAQRQAVDGQRQTVDGQRQTVAGQIQALEAAKAASLQDAVKRKDIEVARQQVANAGGALQTARAQLALDTLHAPLSGRVTLLGATDGQAVDTGTKIATITDLRTLQLLVSVPPASASQVHVGQEIAFTVNSLPGRTFSAAIQAVSPQVDAASGTIPAYCVIDNKGLQLKDDLTARVRIVTERHVGVLTVPQAAILTDPDSGATTVAVVGSDDVLHVVPVKTGLAADGKVEILDGVKAGQNVAVSGQYGLADGAKVQVQSADAGGSHGA